MEDLSNKTALFVDHGLFTFIAEKLAPSFGKMYYYSEWKNAFPKFSMASPGDGVPGLIRVHDIWPLANKVDIVIFPDIYNGELQLQLRSMGKVVWGGGTTDVLEHNRELFRNLQVELGMAVPETAIIVGMTALRDYLIENAPKHVKICTYRGDMESFKHDSYDVTECYLDDLEARLGAQKESVTFIAEDPVGEIEIGFDGWCIDGKFPEICGYGYEVKDCGYVGKIVPYSTLPVALSKVNGSLGPELGRRGMRGFFSTEVRVGADRVPYLLDPCMRAGSPPSEVMIESYDNLAEIIWEGAHGNLVTPRPTGKYTAIAMMESKWADTHWMSLMIPEEVAPWVKLKCKAVKDGRTYFVPQYGELWTIGGVVAVADTMNAAISLVKDRAEQIKAYDLRIRTDNFSQAEEEVKEGRKYGVNF